MKVYTKKGDTGTTQLIGGTRVPKHSLRIETYGTIDELNSYIGLIRDQKINEEHKIQLLEIQDRLFTLGSILASDPSKETMKLPELKESDIVNLEVWIDVMDEVLEPMRNFVLPGGHTTVSFTQIARCVCRRAERLISHLAENDVIDPLVLQYLNRLSDYLFVFARYIAKENNIKEHFWTPKNKS